MGGGYITNLLNKDIKEISKIYLSLISIGIICLGIFLGINITKSSYALFSASIKGEKTIEVEVDTLINKTTIFNYTGTSQEYEVPKDGYYYIELGGAQGGTGWKNSTAHNKGAKTSGYIYLEKGEILYIYVGEKGSDTNEDCSNTNYYFNGGGISKSAKSGICGGSGGGATDIRLVSGEWDNASSLISRIMIASGGAGMMSASWYNYAQGGTLHGVESINANYQVYYGKVATQISGGKAPTKNSSAQSNGTAGSFGKGGYGGANATTATYGGGGGGGSGYYGGSGGSGLDNGSTAGASGSSYISGYAGVNSIEESTTITHTNQTLHYSGKYFIGGKMLEGQNEGNGYAKITYVGTKPEKKTNKLDNVRYIKNCIYGNTDIDDNHWIEVQAIKDGVNIAKGKSVTGNYQARSDRPYTLITDGDLTSDKYATTVNSGDSEQIKGFVNECITVDLGKEYDLDELAVWNLTYEQRRYYDNITSVSGDNSNWTKVIDEASIETSNGHRINAYANTYNGYIQDGLVVWYDGYANTGTIRNADATTWKDLSGNNNNVTLSGATWNYNYLSFDGVNDYAYKTSGVKYNIDKGHTIEVLFKPGKITSSYQSIFNTVDIGTAVLQYGSLWISGNQLRYEIADGSANHISQELTLTTNDLNKYFLMTNIRDNKTYKTYNQGSLIKEDQITWNARTPNPAIYIGKASSYYFQGRIYSIRVYNKALTEEEMLHNYNYDKEKFIIE